MTPADLRALVERGSRDEWRVEENISGDYDIRCGPKTRAIPGIAYRLDKPDAEAIVALHNLAPALLALWEAAEQAARDTACDSDNQWCRDATAILMPALAAFRRVGKP